MLFFIEFLGKAQGRQFVQLLYGVGENSVKTRVYVPFFSGKRKKRSIDSLISGLNNEQKYQLANILLSTKEDDQFS